MTSIKQQIEDAVLTIINGGEFSQEFTADRGPKSVKKLEQTTNLQVIVAGFPVRRQRIVKNKIEWEFVVSVGLFKKVGFDGDGELNQSGLLPLNGLSEEIADALDVTLPGINSNGPLAPEIDYEPDDGEFYGKGIATIQVNAKVIAWTDRH